MPPRPDHNRLQRAYFAWAERFYGRMPPSLGIEARRLDEFLYSRRAIGLWIGIGCALLGSTLGLVAVGFPWLLALGATLFVGVGLFIAGLSAWMQPDHLFGRRAWAIVLKLTVGAFVGASAGFLVGRAVKRGQAMFDDLGTVLLDVALKAAPILVVAIVGTGLLMGTVAALRRQQMKRELADMRLVQERDTAARQAAEAQLKLLQGQIQPHFIFNTLSAVQHWVDIGDPRAAPLLRSLTAFLRGSTELLGRDAAPLADEVVTLQHYLAVMQARLGGRLHSRVEVGAETGAQLLPPGLLLTLVENAVEHGIAAAMDGGGIEVGAVRDGERCVIRVVDTAGLLPDGWQDGVGLGNSRERLAHRFGDRASLTLAHEPGRTVATLVVPWTPMGATP